MKTTTSTILALAALLTACSGARPKVASADPRSPRPDWVDGSSMEYPREQYVVGIGIADDRATAEERSRGEISKVFSANVSVDATVSSSESNKDGKVDFAQGVNQTVRTTSKKILEGVQVVEHWQDNATRVHYALAVLDRAKARAALSDKIGEMDAQAQQWKGQLDSSSDKVDRAKNAMRVLRVLKARGELNAELRVVDPSGQGIKSALDEGAIKAASAKAVAALDVAVDMTGDGSTEIETGVVSGLTAFGIQATKGSKQGADLGVDGNVETKSMDGDGSKWKWARSTVTVTLKDAKTGKMISRFDASDREASADYKEAVRRSHVELSKRVAEQLSTAITAYFEN